MTSGGKTTGCDSATSSQFDQLFPDDKLKSELVRGLYKRALTESQR